MADIVPRPPQFYSDDEADAAARPLKKLDAAGRKTSVTLADDNNRDDSEDIRNLELEQKKIGIGAAEEAVMQLHTNTGRAMTPDVFAVAKQMADVISRAFQFVDDENEEEK